ncbi:MAG: lamin tail domain-containing protein [Prolixibacteraceae bacterium]
MKKILLFAVLFASALLFKACVKDEVYVDPNAKPGSTVALLINEISSNAGDPIPDWLEIYNPTSSEIDISGFGIYDKPAALLKFPAGTKIAAKGYFVVICDVALAATDPTHVAALGLSSAGESAFLVDKDGAIIDQVTFPALPLGVSYARIPDGGTTFANANPTKGTANSNTNSPPAIVATDITNVNDNERYKINVTVSDASGLGDVKIFYQTTTEAIFTSMAPLGSGLFTFTFPMFKLGETVKYYVEAADATGLKSYYPMSAPATPGSVVVKDGLALYTAVSASTTNPAANIPIVISAIVFDNGGVTEGKLYYTVNSEDVNTKLTVTMTLANGIWTGTIPGQANNAVIRYYLRALDSKAQKSYYPLETYDAAGVVTSTFNHDIGSTWPKITVAPPPNWAAIVLNEVCGSQTPDDDWVEFYNNSDAEVDISGMMLIKDGAVASPIYTVPAGTKLAARAYRVITTLPAGTGLLAGISNTKVVKLELTTPAGLVVSMFEKTASNFPTGHPTDGSYQRSPNATGDWVVKTAYTKGTANN